MSFVSCLSWGREPEQETAGVNGRVREQMEWEGKGGLLKTTFQKTPVTASGSFFQPSLWEGFFHKGTEFSSNADKTVAFWVGLWERQRGLVTMQLEVKL